MTLYRAPAILKGNLFPGRALAHPKRELHLTCTSVSFSYFVPHLSLYKIDGTVFRAPRLQHQPAHPRVPGRGMSKSVRTEATMNPACVTQTTVLPS
jgi:hypothetical protein